MRIAVLNGPNLNLLGVREPDVYGSADYASLVRTVSDYASQAGAEVIVAQTNSEGGLVGMIQRCLGRADTSERCTSTAGSATALSASSTATLVCV